MSVKARTFFLCLTAAVTLALAHPAAYAQGDPAGIDSTHYWTYKVLQPQFYPSQVFAKDQFWPSGTQVYLDSLTRLVNWVRKNGSPVRDTFLHYTWWNIRNKIPMSKVVEVSNQFGKHAVSVYALDFLLAPALKNVTFPALPNANHYLCYKAQGFPSPGFDYFLEDEWRIDHQYPLSMEYLCVPCSKDHGGVVYAPVDTATHLALYPIAPYSDLFYPYVQDQFHQGPFPVRQAPMEYLLVPSIKREVITDTKRSTWGKMKTLYR